MRVFPLRCQQFLVCPRFCQPAFIKQLQLIRYKDIKPKSSTPREQYEVDGTILAGKPGSNNINRCFIPPEIHDTLEYLILCLWIQRATRLVQNQKIRIFHSHECPGEGNALPLPT